LSPRFREESICFSNGKEAFPIRILFDYFLILQDGLFIFLFKKIALPNTELGTFRIFYLGDCFRKEGKKGKPKPEQ
jgi:hypothetical protein